MPEQHTVLFVDDEREILIAATLRLGAAGYTILTACDGVDGIALAAECRPDVILLDVRMPRMDGLTALRELKRRSDTKDVPVIMLSASIIDRQAALDAGARSFLKKPYSGDVLVRTVTVALERPAGQRHRAGDQTGAEQSAHSFTNARDTGFSGFRFR